MMVPPGFILPSLSAASSIVSPMRSFTLPPGFKYSSLANNVARTLLATRFNRTIGVLPITSRILLCHIYLASGPPADSYRYAAARPPYIRPVPPRRGQVLRYHKQFF